MSTVADSPEVSVELLMAAALRRQAGTHDHRKLNHARGVSDALAWVLAGMPKPPVGDRLRDVWDDARPPSSNLTRG